MTSRGCQQPVTYTCGVGDPEMSQRGVTAETCAAELIVTGTLSTGGLRAFSPLEPGPARKDSISPIGQTYTIIYIPATLGSYSTVLYIQLLHSPIADPKHNQP